MKIPSPIKTDATSDEREKEIRKEAKVYEGLWSEMYPDSNEAYLIFVLKLLDEERERETRMQVEYGEVVNIDSIKTLFSLLEKERQAAKVLEKELKSQCICSSLRRLTGDKKSLCDPCSTIKLAKQIREGLK